ncbi:MAG: SDR family oxidoreductase [Bacteroidia bacterium]|nr:SDR family oxidoreductase [Bacteroidia bacterium]MBP7437120.1 SDR family oxidoreductase [Bacteroidia bacterium]MBP7772009.1 SDR family oxidoreductase [Bacteroidia bacterium]
MGKFVVAGGRAGIGRALVERLTRSGHDVLVLGRTYPASLPPGCTFFEVDFRNPDAQLPVVNEPISGLAYLPGTIRLKPFRSLKAHDFLEDLQINVLGAIRLMQHLEANLKGVNGGASVVLFSTVAVHTGMPFHSSIALAKGAVEGLARSLAAEWAPSVRVNVIAPTLTNTDLAAGMLSNEQRKQAAIDRHPLKRILEPDEPASLAEWLLTGASQSVSGQVFSLDAGIGSLKTG